LGRANCGRAARRSYPEAVEDELDREYETNPEYFDGLARARQQATADADVVLNACGNYASYISALLNVAEKDDLIERNPLDLSIDKTIGAKKREPWTDAEIKLMYSPRCFQTE
jgi:hypothetical protein